jgi:hypothetical protein
VTLGLAGPEKALDIVGKRIKWFDHGSCDHDEASYGRHEARSRRG